MDKKKLQRTIADNMRVIRSKRRITQEKLSEVADISQQIISCIENERVDARIATLMKIAEALNVTIDKLIYEQ